METPRSDITADGSAPPAPDAISGSARRRAWTGPVLIALLLAAAAFWIIYSAGTGLQKAMDRRYGAEYYTRQVDRAEEQLKLMPESPGALLQVVEACRKLGEYAEASGKGEAGPAWYRAHHILAAMKQDGMPLSPGDLEFLEQLKKKVNP